MIYLGLSTLVIFIFITNPLLKLLCATLFLLVSRVSKLQVKLLPNILLFGSILFINILYPYGEVLYTIGVFTLTKDALLTGVDRAALLIGLIYLSRNITLVKFSLPGPIGSMVKDVFYYFNRFTSGKRVGFKTFTRDLDDKLINIDSDEGIRSETVNVTSSKSIPIMFIITLIIFIVDIKRNSF